MDRESKEHDDAADFRVDVGRSDRGTFVRVTHLPSGRELIVDGMRGRRIEDVCDQLVSRLRSASIDAGPRSPHVSPDQPKSLLMTVDDAFEFEDRLVLTPGVASDASDLLSRTVTLVRPDGSSVEASVVGYELPTPNRRGLFPIALSPGLTKLDVPPGTEVWCGDVRC